MPTVVIRKKVNEKDNEIDLTGLYNKVNWWSRCLQFKIKNKFNRFSPIRKVLNQYHFLLIQLVTFSPRNHTTAHNYLHGIDCVDLLLTISKLYCVNHPPPPQLVDLIRLYSCTWHMWRGEEKFWLRVDSTFSTLVALCCVCDPKH